MEKKPYTLQSRVKMKKIHPCGNDVFVVIRVGADIKIKCEQCGRIIMLPRRKFEKGLKSVLEDSNG